MQFLNIIISDSLYFFQSYARHSSRCSTLKRLWVLTKFRYFPWNDIFLLTYFLVNLNMLLIALSDILTAGRSLLSQVVVVFVLVVVVGLLLFVVLVMVRLHINELYMYLRG